MSFFHFHYFYEQVNCFPSKKSNNDQWSKISFSKGLVNFFVDFSILFTTLNRLKSLTFIRLQMNEYLDSTQLIMSTYN